ncbi:aldo/keto reductase [Planctobacterium marinum]|uniref:Aldo/keto reductase n=2 Tax=Planctobacterium marinum TaxID=1631968 RepID=A0AA48KP97_9ALTE|nr:aldo/keto reductase [Planctobacterium marinum]
MGFGGDWNDEPYGAEHVSEMHGALDAALEAGINFIDHADIYTLGKAESVFGEVIKQRPELREQLIIQSKCGIKFDDDMGPGRYDFSKTWISQSVEGILSRLNIEQLDILLLHRPDPLMDLDEVAEVFAQLAKQGKVKHFGVSNMHVHQIAYLQSGLGHPLVANQLEMSLRNLDWLNESVTAGMSSGTQNHFSPGIIEYCRSNNVQIQAWGCLAQGLFSGRNLDGQPDNVIATASLVAALAEQYNVPREAIVLAWLMRHPAKIQPIIGTTNGDRIKACGRATEVSLTREQWYQLYVTSRGERLP